MGESSPKWRVINDITERIVAGTLALGAYVGTIESVADQYAVTRGAARVALVDLRRAGWVEARGRDGHYVSDLLPPKTTDRMIRRMPLERLELLEERVLALEKLLSRRPG